MRLQLDLEDALCEIARSSGRKTVVICDRGLPDSAAYVTEDDFQSILDEHDWLLDRLMARYSLVLHLESAAIDTSLCAGAPPAARHHPSRELRPAWRVQVPRTGGGQHGAARE